jgi:hypothetical protein
VAIIAKMRISPTKPNSYIATKLAFEVYELLAMLIAVFGLNRTTLRANKFFWIKLLLFLLTHCLSTIFSTSKIRFFAFKTLKVGI